MEKIIRLYVEEPKHVKALREYQKKGYVIKDPPVQINKITGGHDGVPYGMYELELRNEKK